MGVASLGRFRRNGSWVRALVLIINCLLLPGVLAVTPAAPAGAAADATSAFPPGPVYAVYLDGEIAPGMTGFVRRALNEAAEEGAGVVVLEVRTLGGFVNDALQMRDLIEDSPLPVVALIRKRAWSAGVLVALAADRLAMAPGSSIGAAEPRPAEEKIISAWREELEAAARSKGRDPQIAAAMADSDVYIEGVVERGKLLTLTAEEAVDLGFADILAPNRAALLVTLHLEERPVVEVRPSTLEKAARLATGPVVAPILLALGILGIIIEIFTPGFGVPGALGLSSIALYFGAHIASGLSGWEPAALFALGLILLAVEVIVPGFGFFGIAGLVAVGLSIFLVSPSFEQAAVSLSVALAVAVVAVVVLVRTIGPRGAWLRLFLWDRLEGREGYVAPPDRKDLVGQTGRAVTPLRPAGIAEVGGARIDCVSEGGFIARGTEIRVVSVEGPRTVVSEVRKE